MRLGCVKLDLSRKSFEAESKGLGPVFDIYGASVFSDSATQMDAKISKIIKGGFSQLKKRFLLKTTHFKGS